MSNQNTPSNAWKTLTTGNKRFTLGQPLHPRQDIDHRESLTKKQNPYAAVFGCSDSRLAAELIFDVGLGDIFVVRTAGHVLDNAVLGSLEYATKILKVPLIIVLGHDNCGAIQATLDAHNNGKLPPGFIRDIIEKISPSILQNKNPNNITTEHVKQTIQTLTERSNIIQNSIQLEQTAILGVKYRLNEGKTEIIQTIGKITN